MSRKYAGPDVTWGDISRALPPLPTPLGWRIALYPRPANSTFLTPCVELTYTLRNGATMVWRRFGKQPTTNAPQAVMSSLLIGAQEASWYCDGLSADELATRIAWDLGLPIAG